LYNQPIGPRRAVKVGGQESLPKGGTPVEKKRDLLFHPDRPGVSSIPAFMLKRMTSPLAISVDEKEMWGPIMSWSPSVSLKN
jgi:hypothetical protein